LQFASEFPSTDKNAVQDHRYFDKTRKTNFFFTDNAIFFAKGTAWACTICVVPAVEVVGIGFTMVTVGCEVGATADVVTGAFRTDLYGSRGGGISGELTDAPVVPPEAAHD
jgi:hypothetical protein